MRWGAVVVYGVHLIYIGFSRCEVQQVNVQYSRYEVQAPCSCGG